MNKKQEIAFSNEATLPTQYGIFAIRSFLEQRQGACSALEHLVIATKNLPKVPLVRVHSECLTGDVLGSLKCDCGDELDFALEQIAQEGGMVIYLRQEGRGIGLFNKINAYALQDQGLDTIEANLELGFKEDERDYSIVRAVFDFYGLKSIRLLTNNPAKIEVFSTMIEVKREPIIMPKNCYNKQYLHVKKEKMGHLL